MKFCVTGLLLFIFSLGYTQSKEKSITEFSRKDANTGILVDVRTPQEYGKGHIETAINADWFAADFTERVKVLTIDKEKTIFLYCKKGGRSAKAAQVLDSMGYKNVVDLIGGYEAYLGKQ